MNRVRSWLRDRGWISCDKCGRWRPRQWAYNHGWWCGGIAGHYDICNRHELRHAFATIYEGREGRDG